MAAPVPGQKDAVHTVNLAREELIRRRSPGCIHINPLRIGEAFQRVEA